MSNRHTYMKIITTTELTKTQFLVDEDGNGNYKPKFDCVSQEISINTAEVSQAEWDEVAGTVASNPTPPGVMQQLQHVRG